MQVADDGLFDLRQFPANGFLLPEKRQRGRVMAEQQDPLGRAQPG